MGGFCPPARRLLCRSNGKPQDACDQTTVFARRVQAVAGVCVLGVQSGINVCGALVYPTSLRANGSGWQLGIGRFGSFIGPLVGGLFVNLPVEHLYLWSSLPFRAWRRDLFRDPPAQRGARGATRGAAHARERRRVSARRRHTLPHS
jgi:hypothetical protein